MRNAGLEEAQAGIKIARRNINKLRYADDTTLMAEKWRGTKKPLDESERVGLKLNIQKMKIMASGSITSWEIDGETVETVSDFVFWGGSKITADGDCSHEIKRCLLLGRKAMSNLAAAKLLQSCPTLCSPIDGSPSGSPVPGILQARTLEWVAISFSNAWKWKVKVKSLSRVWLFVTPWTAAHQAPSSMGFSRQEYWSGVPLPSPVEGPGKLIYSLSRGHGWRKDKMSYKEAFLDKCHLLSGEGDLAVAAASKQENARSFSPSRVLWKYFVFIWNLNSSKVRFHVKCYWLLKHSLEIRKDIREPF